MKLARSADKRLRSSSIDMPDNLGGRSGSKSHAQHGKGPGIGQRDQGLPRPLGPKRGGLSLSRTH